MPVRFENFDYSFQIKGKPVFVPTDIGRKIGEDVKSKVEDAFEFDDFYYHLRPGGHVAAMHAHRENAFFSKVDLEHFFYSVGRNRVVRALKEIGVDRHQHYGKWSCVRNPYVDPTYSLPYGFVQSPILATLTLALSAVGDLLRELEKSVTVSVYVDDICLSSTDIAALEAAHGALLAAIAGSGFGVNMAKVVAPAEGIGIFNCDLRQRVAVVTEGRIAAFGEVPHSSASTAAFARYVESVAEGNIYQA